MELNNQIYPQIVSGNIHHLNKDIQNEDTDELFHPYHVEY